MFTIDKLTASTEKFQKYVEPQLYSSGLFDPKNSYVIICEGDSDDLKSKMDRFAGIDMCTVDTHNQVVQGIASRVQTGSCYNSFTIRAVTDNGSLDTEFRKRAKAITNGDMYPTWTVQAYVTPYPEDESKVTCTVGIVRTTELFSYMMSQFENENFQTWQDFYDAMTSRFNIGELSIKQIISGGAIFLVCDWDALMDHGVDVTILQETFAR